MFQEFTSSLDCPKFWQDAASWALLASIDGIGPRHFSRILRYLRKHEIPWEEFWVEYTDLALKITIEEFIVENIKNKLKEYNFASYFEYLQSEAISVYPAYSQQYPQLLKNCDDLPPVLFGKGQLPQLSIPLAIVGTRHMTSYGALATRKLTAGLVACGVQVISGFMYGVDVLAQETALLQGGSTVGVLAFGFNQMYPRSHTQLFSEFLGKGAAFLTEHPPERRPVIASFPRRNRLLAGMSLGVLVTEAAIQSGSHITARLAGEYGREVFAVPGPLTNRYSDGTKELVNQGAQLVTCAADVMQSISELASRMGNSIPADTAATKSFSLKGLELLDEEQQCILRLLGEQPQSFSQLQALSALSPQTVLQQLLLLEHQGYTRHEGEVWVLA